MNSNALSEYKVSRVNVRLLKEHIKDPTEALDPKKRKKLTALTSTTESPQSWWFVAETERQPVQWVGFVNSHVRERLEKYNGVSQVCLMFTKVDNRIFV